MPLLEALDTLAKISGNARRNGFGLYLGYGRNGAIYSPSEHGALVLGPPRSGKTSSIIVPNVLAASGSVLCVSTKTDVLQATHVARHLRGRCLLFDPSGAVTAPADVEVVGWSPLTSAKEWDHAVLTADSMVGAARSLAERAEGAHWLERAGALLACILHAGALMGASMREVVAAVNRHDATESLQHLEAHRAPLAFDLLTGIIETDAREQSGIWSTCSGVLAAYRTNAALDSTAGKLFDARAFVESNTTLYIAAGAEHQRHVAPLVAGIVRDIRSAAYARLAPTARPHVRERPPVLLVLDELANIAPLHDLPTLVAEGASQGLLTLACLQDLSQARARWGVAGDGFLSLFGSKVLLGGIGDVRTLEALSTLAGERERRQVTSTRGAGLPWSSTSSRSYSTERISTLAPSDIARPRPGEALSMVGAQFSRISLTPYYRYEPWRTLSEISHDAVRARGIDQALT